MASDARPEGETQSRGIADMRRAEHDARDESPEVGSGVAEDASDSSNGAANNSSDVFKHH